MTLVGPRYHVLVGGPDPPREMGNFFGGGEVATLCTVMGLYDRYAF